MSEREGMSKRKCVCESALFERDRESEMICVCACVS